MSYFPPESFFTSFTAFHSIQTSGISGTVHLLGRFSLICFVTRARVEMSSTIILTTISVIAPVEGIVV